MQNMVSHKGRDHFFSHSICFPLVKSSGNYK
uniref:Uncharacterized protein n=1 Tax=Anguilla anguilla TaxID=7936 RepID=A0A0E9QAS4_ANGAN